MSVAERKAISELVIWGVALFFVWMRLTDGSSILGQTLGLTVVEQSPGRVVDTLIAMGIFAALAELAVLGWFRARREAVDFRDERDRLIEKKADQVGYWVGVAGASLIIGHVLTWAAFPLPAGRVAPLELTSPTGIVLALLTLLLVQELARNTATLIQYRRA